MLNLARVHAKVENVLYSVWAAVLALPSSLSLPALHLRGATGRLFPEPEKKVEKATHTE